MSETLRLVRGGRVGDAGAVRVRGCSSIAGAIVDGCLYPEHTRRGDAVSIPMLVLGALVGWCGTRGPRPPLPKEGIIGVAGGMMAVAGLSLGLGYAAAPSAAELVVLSVAAYAGGRFLNDFVNLVFGSPVRN